MVNYITIAWSVTWPVHVSYVNIAGSATWALHDSHVVSASEGLGESSGSQRLALMSFPESKHTDYAMLPRIRYTVATGRYFSGLIQARVRAKQEGYAHFWGPNWTLASLLSLCEFVCLRDIFLRLLPWPCFPLATDLPIFLKPVLMLEF